MRNIRQLLVAFLMSAVVACGGGGTLDDGGTTPTPSFSIALTLSGAEVSKGTDLVVTAELKSSSGAAQAGKLLKFSLDDSALASFDNGAATAVTDAEGKATIGLKVGTKSGAGTITATFDGTTETKGTISFKSKGDGSLPDVQAIGSIVLYADKLSLGTGVSDKVELTALVRDADNVFMKDVEVKFSADNLAELEVINKITGANGVAKATLTTKSNQTLRTITVKAQATAGETKTSNLEVAVVGTAIEVTSPQAVVLGGTSEISFNLVDSEGNGIPNTPFTLTSALKNSFSNTTPKTGPTSGRANVVYTATNGGTDTITVSALGANRTFQLFVDLDEFNFVDSSAKPVEVPLDVAKPLQVKWLSNKQPVVAKNVNVATTRGAISQDEAGLANKLSAVSQVTDDAGVATIYVKSMFAGFTNIAASSTGAVGAISAQQQIEFVATTPHRDKPIEVQVFPTKVGPGEKSTVSAVVRDINNNPVKNQTVSFSLDDSAGGKLNPATAVTNSFGVATTEFEADTNTGGSGTPADSTGLVVKAQLVANSDIKGQTTIVVGERTLFYRFGTGSEIVKKEQTLYQQQFAIVVTDSGGNPVANQRLNVQVYPKRYYLGGWVRNPDVGAFINYEPIYSTLAPTGDYPGSTCLNEDKNRNGILDLGEDSNEDQMLTPGNVAVAYGSASGEASIVTSNNEGIALFYLQYPREYAPWVDVDLVVSSGNIVGTENINSRTFRLGYAKSDTIVESSKPIGNPYGYAIKDARLHLLEGAKHQTFINELQPCHKY